MSVGGGGALEQWVECNELDIDDCGTEKLSITNGVAIEMNKGTFNMKRVNFSRCKQKGEAAIFKQSNSVTGEGAVD
jgi:hypothetical protein